VAGVTAEEGHEVGQERGILDRAVGVHQLGIRVAEESAVGEATLVVEVEEERAGADEGLGVTPEPGRQERLQLGEELPLAPGPFEEGRCGWEGAKA
jgi:hypothetical protein